MVKREEVDDLFRCLLSGITSPPAREQIDRDQSRQLVSAFNKIDDNLLRRELVVLVEIIAQMPELLQRRRSRWDDGRVVQVH